MDVGLEETAIWMVMALGTSSANLAYNSHAWLDRQPALASQLRDPSRPPALGNQNSNPTLLPAAAPPDDAPQAGS